VWHKAGTYTAKACLYYFLQVLARCRREREIQACTREKRDTVVGRQPATRIVLAGEMDHPLCVYCSAAGHMQLDREEIIESSPLHVTVRPARGRGREEMLWGEERVRKEDKQETKRQKLERETVLASCMDFELIA
jgi:hypothetical protein